MRKYLNRWFLAVSCCTAAILLGCGSNEPGDQTAAVVPDASDPVPAENEDILQRYLGSDTLVMMRGESTFELYSLSKAKWQNWHRDEAQPGLLDRPSPELFREATDRLESSDYVLGKTTLNREQRRKFNRELFTAIGQGTGPRDCFYPTYAVYLQDEEHEKIVLICSLCGCIAVLDPSGGRVRRHPMPVFSDFLEHLDSLLKEQGIASSR